MTAVQLEWRTHNQSEYIFTYYLVHSDRYIEWALWLFSFWANIGSHSKGSLSWCSRPLLSSSLDSGSLSSLVWSGRTYHPTPLPTNLIALFQHRPVVPLSLVSSHPARPLIPLCRSRPRILRLSPASLWWKALFDRPCLFVTCPSLSCLRHTHSIHFPPSLRSFSRP